MSRAQLTPAWRQALLSAAAALLGAACVIGIFSALGGQGTWLAAAAAAVVAAGSVLAGARQWRNDQPGDNSQVTEPAATPAPAGLAIAGLRAGGVLPAVDAMLRFEEEMALASRYGRPLCIGLAGIDVAPGLDMEDAMEGLRHLVSGAVRRIDLITVRDPTSLLIMATETSPALGWVMVERIQRRVEQAGVGTVRFVLTEIGADDSLRSVLQELDSGLEVCRATDALFADPARMLAARA
ncbi:MAG: hypothetical protein M3Z13_05630 [Candidatus Dormibacteraeota bacterium]|nr:hypothetical protein [Candidatus Dormibacteraeota bacterium]